MFLFKSLSEPNSMKQRLYDTPTWFGNNFTKGILGEVLQYARFPAINLLFWKTYSLGIYFKMLLLRRNCTIFTSFQRAVFARKVCSRIVLFLKNPERIPSKPLPRFDLFPEIIKDYVMRAQIRARQRARVLTSRPRTPILETRLKFWECVLSARVQ